MYHEEILRIVEELGRLKIQEGVLRERLNTSLRMIGILDGATPNPTDQIKVRFRQDSYQMKVIEYLTVYPDSPSRNIVTGTNIPYARLAGVLYKLKSRGILTCNDHRYSVSSTVAISASDQADPEREEDDIDHGSISVMS